MSLRAYLTDTVAIASASFTRPSNTTAYTAGQVVSNSTSATTLMKFSNASRSAGFGKGKGGYIRKVQIFTDNKNWASQMRLYLYNVNESGVSVPADGHSMTTIYADRVAYLGYIDIPAMANDDAGANSTGAYGQFVPTQPFSYETATTVQPNYDDAIYGVLVDKTGGTPTSGQNFTVTLTFQRA